jgi:hypothetical protein
MTGDIAESFESSFPNISRQITATGENRIPEMEAASIILHQRR